MRRQKDLRVSRLQCLDQAAQREPKVIMRCCLVQEALRGVVRRLR
jgi:hypothetical protein